MKKFLQFYYYQCGSSQRFKICVLGQNRCFYKDEVGQYVMDDFGHQIYYFDHGQVQCHVTCDGSFKQVLEVVLFSQHQNEHTKHTS